MKDEALEVQFKEREGFRGNGEQPRGCQRARRALHSAPAVFFPMIANADSMLTDFMISCTRHRVT